ncbi:ABC transporter ATP-binding protein [bacterium]|nr:MAG: ABC transporter ATP-binding protein [bacterium]
MAALLQLKEVTKAFGSLRVLDALDLEVDKGEIRGLIGPNGAGKTTLFNVIAGALRGDHGVITLDGSEITHFGSANRCRRGLARTFQVPKLFVGMTVLENAEVAALFGNPGHQSRSEAVARARWALNLAGIGELAGAKASVLTTGQRKMLELARAIATGAKLLLLDEVMAGLNPTELQHACDSLRALQTTGFTILMVEHVMQALMSLSHRVSVLFSGKIIMTDVPERVACDPRVIEAYLGKARGVA